MTCDEVKTGMQLYLYGELSFDEEERFELHIEDCRSCREELARAKVFHHALDAVRTGISPEFLAECRTELFDRIGRTHQGHGFRNWLADVFSTRFSGISVVRPVGAVALIAMGFFGARLLPSLPGDRWSSAGLAPIASRVRNVEPEGAGKIQIVVDETRQRIMRGSLEDEDIQQMLLVAAKDPADPGLRVESVDLLKSRPESAEIRDTLLYVLLHDSNAGVRLKALDGLKQYGRGPEVRKVLSQVLLSDANPGVRTGVIDLLIQEKGQRMAGTYQELMRTEQNGYVRMQCEKALRDMKASVGTF